MAGDFNVEINYISAFAILHDAGFKDVQDVAAERWGLTPKPISKGKTRKDFLFLSPEVQNLFMHLEVVDDVWPDHAIFSATFSRLSTSVPRQLWYSPSAFPWPDSAIHPQWWDCSHPNLSLQYARLWQHIE